MPNWVDCDLVVEGPNDELQKFKKFAKEGKNVLSPNKFIPQPKSANREWRLENWGTESGFVEAELVEEKENRLTYGFGTSWSAPLPVIRKMGEVFPSLTFTLKYYEGGNGFKGIYEVKGKCVIKDEYSEHYRGNRGG